MSTVVSTGEAVVSTQATTVLQTARETVTQTATRTVVQTTTKAAPAQRTTPPSTQSSPSATFIPRTGYAAKALGQLAGIESADGRRVVDFVVTKIDTNLRCDSTQAQAAENGGFIGVYLKVSVLRLFDPNRDRTAFGADNFTVLDRAGARQPSPNTTAAALCLKPSEVLAARQELPDSTAEGWVVLDSKAKGGSLLLEIAGGSGGWEWRF